MNAEQAIAEALRQWQRDELSRDFATKTPTTLWVDRAETPAAVAVNALRSAVGRGLVIVGDDGCIGTLELAGHETASGDGKPPIVVPSWVGYAPRTGFSWQPVYRVSWEVE